MCASERGIFSLSVPLKVRLKFFALFIFFTSARKTILNLLFPVSGDVVFIMQTANGLSLSLRHFLCSGLVCFFPHWHYLTEFLDQKCRGNAFGFHFLKTNIF